MHSPSVMLRSLPSKNQLRFFVKDRIGTVGSPKMVPVFEENHENIFAFLEKEDCAHLFSDSPYVPVASEIHCTDSIEELIAQHNAALPSTCREVCLWVESSTWGVEESLFALLYAIYFNKKVVSLNSLDEFTQNKGLSVRDHYDSWFFIMPYSLLDGESNLKLAHFAKPMGFLPFTDYTTLSLYLLKRIVLEDKLNSSIRLNSVLANRIKLREDEAIQANAGQMETHYLPRDHCSLESTSDLMFRQSRLIEFNYMSHCRECAIVMNDYLFCSVQAGEPDNDNNTEECNKFAPRCLLHTDQCCIENRKRLSIKDLYAKFLFLNGCNLGDGAQSFIPYRHTIVRNLIEGHALSVITTPSIKIGDVSENILAHNISKYGYTEGVKTQYINEFLRYSGIENNYYYQIGDPSLMYGGLKVKKTRVSMTDASKVEVTLSDIAQETYAEVDIQVEESSWHGLDIAKISLMDSDHRQIPLHQKKLYFAFIKSDVSRVKLLLFSNQPFECDEIHVVITVRNHVEEAMKRIEIYQDSLDFFKECVSIGSNLKGKIEDIHNYWKSVPYLYRRYRYCLQSRNKLEKMIRKLEQKYLNVSQEIYSQMVSYTSSKRDIFFEKISEKRTNITALAFTSTCYDCGYASARFESSILTGPGKSVKRISYKCFQCGCISDFPEAALSIKGNPYLRFGREGLEAKLYEISNQQNVPLEINIAGISIDSELIDVEIDQDKLVIQPGESSSILIKLKPSSELKQGVYLFSFYILVNSQFYYLSKTFGYEEK